MVLSMSHALASFWYVSSLFLIQSLCMCFLFKNTMCTTILLWKKYHRDLSYRPPSIGYEFEPIPGDSGDQRRSLAGHSPWGHCQTWLSDRKQQMQGTVLEDGFCPEKLKIKLGTWVNQCKYPLTHFVACSAVGLGPRDHGTSAGHWCVSEHVRLLPGQDS